VNSNLTNKVKEYALNLGASLVGVANIERFEKAPIMMSPKGLMPSAKSVILGKSDIALLLAWAA